MQKKNEYSTSDICRAAGISVVTLYTWLKKNKFPEPVRNRKNKRIFSENEKHTIVKYAHQRKKKKKTT